MDACTDWPKEANEAILCFAGDLYRAEEEIKRLREALREIATSSFLRLADV